VAGLGLVHSLDRAYRAVVPATAWHLVVLLIINFIATVGE